MADQQQDGTDQQPQDEGTSQQGNTQGDAANFQDKARKVAEQVIEKIQEQAPVVAGRIQEGVQAGAKKVEEVAPEIGHKLREGLDVAVRKAEEMAPVVRERVQEGAAKVGEAVEDLRGRLAARGEQQPKQDAGEGSGGEPPTTEPPNA